MVLIPAGLEDHPMHRISRYEGCACGEWEKSARGTNARHWPWGNKFSEKNALMWDRGEFSMTASVYAHPDGISPYGVYEMAGNVEEWTAD